MTAQTSTASPSPTATPIDAETVSTKTGWRARWRRHRKPILIIGVATIGVSVFWGQINLEAMHHWAEHVSPWMLFAALVLLPLTTFPVTPLNVIAGIRFGFAEGLLLVAGAIVLQHVLAFFTAQVLPRPLKRRMDPLRSKLPPNAHMDAAVFTSLLPGAPYWAQLYVLPLLGVPFLLYVGVSSVLHAIRSCTAVLAGQLTDEPRPAWIVALLVYGGLLALACFFAGRRMHRKYGEQPPANPREQS